MIIKASDALRRAVLAVPTESKIVPLPGAVPEKLPDMSEVTSLIPDWFQTMLYDGSVIIIDSTEYDDLAPEVKAHLEVLSS